jgi:hypothetical protein
MPTSSNQQPNKFKLHLSIYNSIKDTNSLPKSSLKKSALQYYLSMLKKANLIRKIGYGTWETIAPFDENKIKQVQIHNLTSSNLSTLSPNLNLIRSHAFIFKIKIPKSLNNWHKREEYLTDKQIAYMPNKIKALGQQLIIDHTKVWLTNKSIVIHESKDFIANSAREGKNYALDRMLTLIEKIEALLNCSFKINKKYLFKVSREHHSKLKCELAIQYRKEGKKLYVYDDKGLWMWIDFSDHIDEREIGNRVNAALIMDNRINPFFNGLKEIDGFTPKWVTDTLAELVKDRAYYAENLKTHVAVIRQLGQQVSKVASGVKKLNSKIYQKKLTEW